MFPCVDCSIWLSSFCTEKRSRFCQAKALCVVQNNAFPWGRVAFCLHLCSRGVGLLSTEAGKREREKEKVSAKQKGEPRKSATETKGSRVLHLLPSTLLNIALPILL